MRIFDLLIESTALSHRDHQHDAQSAFGFDPALKHQQQGHPQGVWILSSSHPQDTMLSGCGWNTPALQEMSDGCRGCAKSWVPHCAGGIG
jgi:hypothetical protein